MNAKSLQEKMLTILLKILFIYHIIMILIIVIINVKDTKVFVEDILRILSVLPNSFMLCFCL